MEVKIGPYPDYGSDRPISIEIAPYDIWNMHHTLALIIHPMLELLCKSGHGAPPISNEDVPEGLHKPEGMAPSEIDTAYFARWEYVLNEMRWSFDQLRVRDLPEETTRIDNGLRLFGKYYRDLWT